MPCLSSRDYELRSKNYHVVAIFVASVLNHLSVELEGRWTIMQSAMNAELAIGLVLIGVVQDRPKKNSRKTWKRPIFDQL